MKTKIKNGKEYIFDLVRKKYVQNQPEEWVRQHIIEYLNKEKGYPISLMSIEKNNPINNINKTCSATATAFAVAVIATSMFPFLQLFKSILS